MHTRMNPCLLKCILELRGKAFIWRKSIPRIKAVAESDDELVILRGFGLYRRSLGRFFLWRSYR